MSKNKRMKEQQIEEQISLEPEVEMLDFSRAIRKYKELHPYRIDVLKDLEPVKIFVKKRIKDERASWEMWEEVLKRF